MHLPLFHLDDADGWRLVLPSLAALRELLQEYLIDLYGQREAWREVRRGR
jgi:hypothetical protein